MHGDRSPSPSAPPTVLAIFAHPDDESLMCGGTLARLADAGVRVVLMCGSRGERGSVSDPELVAGSDLGTVRVRWCRTQEYYDQDAWRGTWRYDGGILANQASHHVDLLEWMMGNVDSVFVNGTALIWGDAMTWGDATTTGFALIWGDSVTASSAILAMDADDGDQDPTS